VPKSLHTPAQRKLAALLRQAREEAGVRQVELAKALGRSQSFVSKVEAGERRVDLVELRSMLQALDADLVQFVERWDAMLRQPRRRR